MRDMVSTLPDLVVPQQYREVVERIAATAADLARADRRRRSASLDAAVGENADGDRQTALDLMADEAFRAALTGAGVRFYASEEQDRVVELDAGRRRSRWRSTRSTARRTSTVNVLDRHDLRASTAAEATAEASFLRPGRELAGAGYVIYGPQLLPRRQLRRGGAESISSTRGAGASAWRRRA